MEMIFLNTIKTIDLWIKQNLNNPGFLHSQNITSFNNLSDDEIKVLFEAEDIDIDLKIAIAELGYERIKTLPFDLFIKALFYMENSYLFVSNYKSRIEILSFEELISLLYDAELDGPCLVEITKMDVFSKYLKYEKENKVGTKLQSFQLLSLLYLNKGDIEKLDLIGKKIINLLQSSINYSSDLEYLIEYYLNEIIENNEEISLESNINSVGIALMNYSFKNHQLLSNKLIEFYILYRLKDLKVQDLCKRVVISDEKSSIFGYYQASNDILKIYSSYLSERFEPILKENNFNDRDAINDFLNLNLLKSISHELGHVVIYREVDAFQKKLTTYDQLQSNIAFYYWYKNGSLRLFLGDEKYQKFHDRFIEENRCDIFSIFDSSIQIDKYFKNSFSTRMLQGLCLNNADEILRFYTDKNENNEIVIKTPMQKFDEFFSSVLPNQEKEIHLTIDNTPNAIINSLMLGGEIPQNILQEISKIAKGEIITTNLYSELLKIINNMQTLNNENDVGMKK